MAKVTMVRPNLTLHELMYLRPEEVAKKRVTYATYFNLAESKKLWRLPTGPLFEACDRHLCEEVVKRFYRRVRDEFPELEDLLAAAYSYSLKRNPKKHASCVPGVVACLEKKTNYVDETDLSHFHVACRFGFCDVVERFIEAGQSPDFRPLQTVDPPLHLALHHGHWKAAELLLSRGHADPIATSRDRLTALHVLSQNQKCDTSLAQTLLRGELDVRVDAWDKFGNTPLHLALHYGNAKMVELLLRHGANTNFVNGAQMAPLHVISRRDPYGNLAELFFGVAADEMYLSVRVDARDNKGNTPLHYALQRGLKRVVVLLLKRGVDPNLAGAGGGNCLHILCRQQCDGELIDAFFEVINDRRQLMEVNARDERDDTPLHLALARDHQQVFQLLLRIGTCPNLTDEN
ncbi:tankyrase-2-like [Trichogramma pretiosum]|uniref:tankyrase-2-like n=1 Tax=Trichogramma pretiosum TaxID=7493 RepID=UPI000C718B36|nr:tankyrase-2-like [Trichogramma pretiosum]